MSLLFARQLSTISRLGIAALAALSFSAVSLAQDAEPAKGTRGSFGKSKALPGEKLMTRQELQACLKLDTDIKATGKEAAAEQKGLGEQEALIKKTNQDLAAAKEKLDNTNAQALADYKAQVEENDKRIDSYNARLPKFNKMVEDFDGQRKAWKDTCADKPYDEYDFWALKKQERDAAKKAQPAKSASSKTAKSDSKSDATAKKQ